MPAGVGSPVCRGWRGVTRAMFAKLATKIKLHITDQPRESLFDFQIGSSATPREERVGVCVWEGGVFPVAKNGLRLAATGEPTPAGIRV